MCFFKENLLDPEEPVEAGGCYGDNKGGTENTARWRRALNVEEAEEEEAGAGEMRWIWVVPRDCQS